MIQRLYKFESNENLLNNFGNRKSLRMLGAETIRNNCGLIHHQVLLEESILQTRRRVFAKEKISEGLKDRMSYDCV